MRTRFKIFGRRKARCPETTGTTFIINSRSHFQCDLPKGHEGLHEHNSAVLRTQWEMTGPNSRYYPPTKTGRVWG